MSINRKRDLLEYLREIYLLKTKVVKDYHNFEKSIDIDDFTCKYSNISSIKTYSNNLENEDETFQLKYIKAFISKPNLPEKLNEYIVDVDGDIDLNNNIEIPDDILSIFNEYRSQVDIVDYKNKLINEYNEFYKYLNEVIRRKEVYEEKLEIVYCRGLLKYHSDNIKGCSEINRHVFEIPLTITEDIDSNVIKLTMDREQNCKFVTNFLSVINGFEIKSESSINKLTEDINELFSDVEYINFDDYFDKYLNYLTFNYEYLGKDSFNNIENEKFYIKDEECIVIRKKQPTIWVEDLNNIIQKMDENEQFEFENKIIDLVLENEDDEKIKRLITSEVDNSRILFPLPSNDEQYKVIQQLQNSNLVLMQGPPGTGKSHTIANLISTYVANGKKILVTSEKSKALEVIKEKLPEKIRKLSMTILNENKNDKDLADSISYVLERFKDKDYLYQYEERITNLEKELDKIDYKILINKEELLDFLENNTKSYELDVKELIPQNTVDSYMLGDLARYLKNNSNLDIIEDRNEFSKIQIQKNFINDYNCIYNKIRENNYVEKQILPNIDDLMDLYNDIEAIKFNDENENFKIFKNELYDIDDETIDKVIYSLKVIDEVNKKLDNEFINNNKSYKPILNNVSSIIEFCEQNKQFFERVETRLLEIKYEPENRLEIKKILQQLITMLRDKGKIGLFDKVKMSSDLKRIQTITISGEKLDINDISKLELLQEKIKYDIEVKELTDRIEKTLKFIKPIEMNENEMSRYIDKIIQIAKMFLNYTKYENICNTIINEKFSNNIEITDFWNNKEFMQLIECLSYLKEYRVYQNIVVNSKDILGLIREKTKNCLELFEPILVVVENKDWLSYESQKRHLAKVYELDAEYKKFIDLYKDELGQYDKFIKEFKDASEDNKNWILQNWNLILNYYKVKMLFLDETSKNKNYDNILKERHKLQKDRTTIVINLIEEQAWYYQIKNMNNLMAKSLSKWLTLKQKLGKGTGKRANATRKAMQLEMQNAKDAIPIWIMPADKVVEQYPFSEIPQFDLVIMDESSQSSVISISALLRGKKNLIVGDDKQISPQSVGIEVKELQRLQAKYLYNTSLVSFLDNETSIYDLAQSVCGSRKVVLKEHFRCLPEIIEYSNIYFYNSKINCLKVRSKDNTIPESIKTEYVEDATVIKKGGQIVNLKEISKTVQILNSIENDSDYDNKTIGIIILQNSSLHLNLLNDELQNNFSSNFRQERKLKIGTTYDFQGDERDVIILSMLVSKNYQSDSEEYEKNIMPLTRLSFERSFNVAASRAKEQVILIHSVTLEDLIPNDLRYSLLSYYIGYSKTENSKEELIFNSDFEKDIYKSLTSNGISLVPHYKVGKYELDFVIENELGLKIAIECDGDIYRSSNEYEQEIKEQSVLERCGWTFIRISSSSYYYDENTIANVMDKIKEALNKE